MPPNMVPKTMQRVMLLKRRGGIYPPAAKVPSFCWKKDKQSTNLLLDSKHTCSSPSLCYGWTSEMHVGYWVRHASFINPPPLCCQNARFNDSIKPFAQPRIQPWFELIQRGSGGEAASQCLGWFMEEIWTCSHQSSPFYFLLNLSVPQQSAVRGGWITGVWAVDFGSQGIHIEGQSRQMHADWDQTWGLTSALCKSVRLNEVFIESIKFSKILLQLVQFMCIRKEETPEFVQTISRWCQVNDFKQGPRILVCLKTGILWVNLVDKMGCRCWYVQPVPTSHKSEVTVLSQFYLNKKKKKTI